MFISCPQCTLYSLGALPPGSFHVDLCHTMEHRLLCTKSFPPCLMSNEHHDSELKWLRETGFLLVWSKTMAPWPLTTCQSRPSYAHEGLRKNDRRLESGLFNPMESYVVIGSQLTIVYSPSHPRAE